MKPKRKRCPECRGWLIPYRDQAVKMWRCEECPNFVTPELWMQLPTGDEGPRHPMNRFGVFGPERNQYIAEYIAVKGPRGEGYPAALVNCPDCTGTLEWLNHAKLWRCDQCHHQETDQRNIERTAQARDEDKRLRKQATMTHVMEGTNIITAYQP